MGKINDLTDNINKETIREKLKENVKQEIPTRAAQFTRQGLDGMNLTTSTKNDGMSQQDEAVERSIYRQASKIKESHDKKNSIREADTKDAFSKNAKYHQQAAETSAEENEAIFKKREAQKRKELRDKEDQDRRRLEKEEQKSRRNSRDANQNETESYDNEGRLEQQKTDAEEEYSKEFDKLKKKKDDAEKLDKLKAKEKDSIQKEKSGKYAKLGKGEEKINSGHGLAKLRGSEEKTGTSSNTVRKGQTTTTHTTANSTKTGKASGSAVKKGAKAVAEGGGGWILLIIIAIFLLIMIFLWIAGILGAEESENQTINSVDTTGYDTEAARVVFSYLYDVFDGNTIAVCGVMGNLYCESAGTMHGNQLEDGFQGLFGFPSGVEGDTKYTNGIDSGNYIGHPHFKSGSKGASYDIIDKFAHDFGYYNDGYFLYAPGHDKNSTYPNSRSLGAGYGIGQFTTSSYKIDIYHLAKHKDWKVSVGDTKMQLYYMVGSKKSNKIPELDNKLCAYDQSGGTRTELLKDIKADKFDSTEAALEYATAVAFTWECGYSASNWQGAIKNYTGGKGAYNSWPVRFTHAKAFYALYGSGGPVNVENFPNKGDFAELEGTYIFQQSSGPCEMCALANLIKRYCYMLGDKKWNEFNVNLRTDDGRTLYQITNAGGKVQSSWGNFPKGSESPICEYHAGWTRQGNGSAKIHGIDCKWTQTQTGLSKAELIAKLKACPEGIAVTGTYAPGKGHAKVINGYDPANDAFLTIDPGAWGSSSVNNPAANAQGRGTMYLNNSQCWNDIGCLSSYIVMTHTDQYNQYLKDKSKKEKKDKDSEDKDSKKEKKKD